MPCRDYYPGEWEEEERQRLERERIERERQAAIAAEAARLAAIAAAEEERKRQEFANRRFGKGLCNKNYTPNKGNYTNNTTDCGLNDGVFNDWRNRGGHCHPYMREDSRCGTGCRWAGGARRCVDTNEHIRSW
jgi:hypothetical protein